MKFIKLNFFLILLIFSLSSCMSAKNGLSGSGLVGNALNSSYSLSDMRAARQAVEYKDEVPPNVEVLGNATTRRCHRDATAQPPQKATLVDDLRLFAYGYGADGIAKIVITTQSGLMQNCWQLYDAKVIMYKKNK